MKLVHASVEEVVLSMRSRSVVDIDHDGTHDLNQKRLPRVTQMEKYKEKRDQRNEQRTQAPPDASPEGEDENPDIRDQQ
jgi:hypothetical protein